MSYYVANILNTKSDAHFHFATEEDCWSYVKENLVSFIYTINQPMRANQSPFTNVSVYDDVFLDKLVDDYIFPDGSSPNKEIIKKIQEMYLDIMNDELRRTPLTFPVTTACFSIDSENNINDESFLKMIAEKNKEFGFINIYCGDSSTLSSCCFDGKQEAYIKVGWNNKFVDTLENIYRKYYNKTIKIFHEGTWQKGKPIRIRNKHKMYKIVTIGDRVLYATDNHIHCTYRGDVFTTELTTEDALRVYKDGVVSFDRICEISEYDYSGEYVYCFEMENQKSPYFTLENGVTTHNCRLRSEQQSEYFNSFGSGDRIARSIA